MATKQQVKEALASIGVPLNAKASTITKAQERILKAAPLYLTDAQCAMLKEAGKQGWVGRSIVVDIKSRQCALSIEAGNHVAWIRPDGQVEAEELIVKAAGILNAPEAVQKH